MGIPLSAFIQNVLLVRRIQFQRTKSYIKNHNWFVWKLLRQQQQQQQQQQQLKP